MEKYFLQGALVVFLTVITMKGIIWIYKRLSQK